VRRQGFTLLEVLVATAIMAIAVAGLLSALSTSMRNASRLTDYDRAALLARRQMDELLLQRPLPHNIVLEGPLDPSAAGGLHGGWKARVTPFEMPPGAGPGTRILERLELQIWWQAGGRTRNFTIEAFRPGVLLPL
jgi:general secretion pathway protein I